MRKIIWAFCAMCARSQMSHVLVLCDGEKVPSVHYVCPGEEGLVVYGKKTPDPEHVGLSHVEQCVKRGHVEVFDISHEMYGTAEADAFIKQYTEWRPKDGLERSDS